jgi:glutamate racemase
LGCTHYPFVIDVIRQLVPGVSVIDPAPAVARQVDRVLRERNWQRVTDRMGQHHFITSGDGDRYRAALRALVQVDSPVLRATWNPPQRSLTE